MPVIINKLKAVYFIIKNNGFGYFFKKHILENFIRNLFFGHRYIFLRSIEFYLPAEHKHKYSLPSYLQLEPTSRCNMKCRNCSRDTMPAFGDLSLDNFLYIIKQLPYLKKVKLQGLGEPLLNSSLFDMANLLKRRRITTYLATNGSLVTERLAASLVKYFDQIEISIDSADSLLFKEIRGNDCLEEVIRGARLLRSASKNNDLAVNIVVEKNNISHLPAIVRLVHNLGISHINIVALQNWINNQGKHIDRRKEISAREPDIRDFDSYLKEAMVLAKSFNIYCDFSSPDTGKNRCFWYKRGVYISWNGYVSPCCVRPDYTESNFGNILEKDFRQIWNSRDYIRFRQELNTGKAPAVCKGCSYIMKEGVF